MDTPTPNDDYASGTTAVIEVDAAAHPEAVLLAQAVEHLRAIRELLEGVTAGLSSMMTSPMGRLMGRGGNGGGQ